WCRRALGQRFHFDGYRFRAVAPLGVLQSAVVFNATVTSWLAWIPVSVTLAGVVWLLFYLFFFQAEDGIRDATVTGVQTCALPISCSLLPIWSGCSLRSPSSSLSSAPAATRASPSSCCCCVGR